MVNSPYLLAIQSLEGKGPDKKYMMLHLIAKQINDNKKERAQFVKTGKSKRVKSALHPYLRIIFGSKFQIDGFVVKALKSDDVTIVRQALSARWFFSGSSPLIEVTHFMENVVSQVSVRTRRKLIKTLAFCLVKRQRKAEHFFDSFSERYGVEHSLPLLIACSKTYIFDAVLRRRIDLPKRILTALYRRYPDLAIRYLRLGNTRCKENKADRKLHRIDLSNYVSFLPQLVKRHIKVFIELYECLALNDRKAKLGSTRANSFLKNATETLIEQPRIFLDMLPLKLVSNKLTTQQFDTMFEKMLVDDSSNFRVSNVINYLKYYPQEKKLNLLISAYKKRYGNDLLDNAEAIFSVKEEFYKLLPNEVKEERARKYVKSYEGKPDYYEKVCFLPPSESLLRLEEKISKTSNIKIRSQYIVNMIISCSFYNSKEDLLKVLEYYNTRHKNEQALVLQKVLGSLVQRFDIAKLDKAHWQILKDIIQWSYVKGFLKTVPVITYVPLFSGALRYYIKRGEANDHEDTNFLDKLVRIIIQLFFEKDMKWDFINELSDLGRDWLCKFLKIIPEIYSEDDTAWNEFDNKLMIAMYLIRAMQFFNEKGEPRKRKHKKASATTSDSEEGRSRPRFTIKDYPWLKKLVRNLLKPTSQKSTRESRLNQRRFVKILQQHDAELYQSLIDEDEELTNDVQCEDALLLLKRDHDKILGKWKLYLDACRRAVKYSRRSVQRFIISTKWHDKIPLNFVQQCAAELKVEGNALILGLLLEGEKLAKVITPYVPKESQIDVRRENAKRTYEIVASLPKAMILANPPVSFNVLSSFCKGDYITKALQSLINVGQRMPVDKVLAFVKRNYSQKPVAVKKLAIRLVFQVVTRSELRDILLQLWSEEHNHSVREVLAKLILDLFKKSPTQDSWTLLKLCIEGLTFEDRNIFTLLEQLNQIDTSYIALYLEEFIKKLDSFTNEQFEKDSRLGHLQSAVTYINEELMRHLPEKLMKNILERCLLRYPAFFTIDVFLFSDIDKFETRLNVFINILMNELKEFNVPDINTPRCCSKNWDVRVFFAEIVRRVYRQRNKVGNSPIHLDLINAILYLIESELWKEPRSVIELYLCKSYLEVKTPNEFGQRCVAIARHLVNLFCSEFVLAQFSEILLTKVLQNDYTYCTYESLDCKLSIVGSMMREDLRIGSLIGIKLLSHYEVSRYDARYDDFMKIWKAIEDKMVQAVLSEFVNSNRLYYRTDNSS